MADQLDVVLERAADGDLESEAILGWVAASEHGRTRVQFCQMRDDVGHARSLRRNERIEVCEEAYVGECFESHPYQ
jgi:hypothetical protein